MTVTAPQLLNPAGLHPVAASLARIEGELSSYFKERRTCIEAVGLALLTAEHAFILGPPGTAKSFLIRAFFGRFPDAAYFEQLLSKTMPPEAVLGPYDIPELREHGHLHRKYQGFLPTAKLAMLDEIGKMSPTLGHNLLAVLNERLLHQVNGGRSAIELPLSTVVGGSNELPTQESDDAAAMWDRMLIRIVVGYIQETGNFIAVLTGPKNVPAGTTIAWADMQDVIDNVVPAVTLPNDVMEVVAKLREQLKGAEISPSDRRWKQSMKLLQASAFMAGRSEATTDDIQVLRHSLWEIPTQIAQVERMTLSVSNPIAEKALGILEKAQEVAQEVRNSKGLALDKRAAIGTELHGRLKSCSEDLGRVRQEALSAGASVTKLDASVTKLDEVSAQISGIKASILQDLMGLDLASLK
jgi:MoxR-like ATPase